ncbi:hypothetical protein DSCO28_24530 [Desulfosarcina ovata subsp. sediminis]|uniref:NACHT domain-containing protein n=1 Tax=Desulfosarcina ovata subsp. sediminis TaxID=885957 RepID=A0A5K7ZNK2_9BACT|nr:NACHT domain-containing protein [Desulfosarcina ovata]BBO81887.1 hypothetical protein DSCO28_24530 [Desulfosarcina ovata subsp. sediminis]
MADKRKDKTTDVKNAQIGVLGDNTHVEGGIHFHHYHGRNGDAAETDRHSKFPGNHEPFDPSQAANILHFSDLHFGTDENSDPVADAKRWASQLTDDLVDELNCQKLHGLIVSGDVGNISEPGEYEAAEIFIRRVCGKFGLGADHCVIVPGNHDLNWPLSRKGYRLMDLDDCDLKPKEETIIPIGDGAIRLRNDDTYPERFKHFSHFHEETTGQPYETDPAAQATLHHFPALNLLVVGFSSVWEADHHFKNRISINPDAVAAVLDRIRDTPSFEGCLKFAVWHHPLSSPDEDRIKDHGFLQRLAGSGFQVCLHGHIHKADAGLFRYDMAPDGRSLHIVGAGTFGAPAREWSAGYPLQYNLLRLYGSQLRVEPNGAWEPDHLWRQGKGKPHLAHYDILLAGHVAAKVPGAAASPATEVQRKEERIVTDLEREIGTYRRKAESLHESLPVAGFATVLKVPIDVEDIYIPLRAMLNLRGVDDLECYGDAATAEKHLGRCEGALEISLFDAFREADRRNQKGLVILGDPGSGKTTHMKRLLLWCLRNGPEGLGLPQNMLPVFLPLRELEHIEAGLDRFIQDQLASRHLKMRSDFGERLLRRGNLLFLLDGLDEVADLAQREEVVAWIEEAFTDHPDCRFVVTCRFAGYSPTVRLNPKFMEMHVRPLSEADAEAFVRNWYAIVEKGLARDVEQAESIL